MCRNQWGVKQYRRISACTQSSLMHALFSGLTKDKFTNINNLDSTHEIWTTLEEIHRDTTWGEDTCISTLIRPSNRVNLLA
jgi:hypothetical protein